MKTTEAQPARDLLQLLELNVGATIRVRFGSDEVVGELVALERGGKSADLVLMKTHDGLIARRASQVQEVVLLDGQPKLQHDVEKSEVRLKAELDPVAMDRVLSLDYLTKGIAWAPSYRLELGEGGKALIAARADLINDAFDLMGVDVYLVSGFPNLRFSDVPGVLALQRTLENFLQAMGAPANQAMQFANGLTQNVLSNAYMPFNDSGMVRVEGGGFRGEGAEDMFRTSLGKLNLEKGGRSTHPLFRAEIPCEQFYRWEVRDYIDHNNYYRVSTNEEKTEEVWHTLRLDNTTNSPWTTGPITVFSKDALVGQDVSYYTSSGGSSLVKVTKALDLRAEESEIEVSRVKEPDRIWGDWYDRVRLKGTLLIRNHKGEKVKVEVVKTLSGEVKRVTGEPHDTALARGLRQINTMHELCWEAEVEADAELKLEYEYDVLVRR